MFETLRSVLQFRELELDPVERRLARAANVDDLRSICKRRLPGGVFDYIDGAAEDEVTLRRSLEALEAAETKVLHTRASLGGRIRRLEISLRRTQLETFEFQELRSQEGDTDLAAAIVRFNQHQTTYQAALQTSANLLQQSILDFLV